MRRLAMLLGRRAAGEGGAVMILVAAALPAFIAFGVFVVDVGNWWVHKRHLQVQADAAALAGAQKFRFPGCDNNAIAQEAIRYSGGVERQTTDVDSHWDAPPAAWPGYTSQHNGFQEGKDNRGTFRTGVNRPNAFGRNPEPARSGIDQDLKPYPRLPCDTGMVDVKMTERDLPWLFVGARQLFSIVGGGDPNSVEFIDAQARVQLKTLNSRRGMLPLGVPDVVPKRAHVWFYEETGSPSTAQLLGEADLLRDGKHGRLAAWSNSVTVGGTPVVFSPRHERMAVRIGLSGAESVDWQAADVCSKPLVECYGYGAPPSSPATSGVTRVRGVDPAGSGVRVGQVSMLKGTCSNTTLPADTENGYFATSCSTVTASVQLLGASKTAGTLRGRVTGMQGKQTNPLTFRENDPATTVDDRWVGAMDLNLAGGAHKLDLTYTESGSGSPCPNSSPCTFNNVHSSFRGSEATSGPLKMVRVDTATGTNINNVPRCASPDACPQAFVVRIGLSGDLALAEVGDDPISLKMFNGSQTQALDCDPSVQLVRHEVAQGCKPWYEENTGTACPAGHAVLWASPQPWTCVAIQTGTFANELARGLNLRVFGKENPGKNSPCPYEGSNRWPNYPDDDKRIVPMFRVPYGSFSGSGNTTVPVVGFAWFYVTGWSGNGGFESPCADEGDTFAEGTKGDNGAVSGHFIIRVDSNEGGASDTNCDTTIVGGCVAVMTK